MKTLKFTTALADAITRGEKTTTWRVFDDKNLQIGDVVSCLNSDISVEFCQITLTEVTTITFREITPEHYKGHASYSSVDDILDEFKGYYGDSITADTEVKIIAFNIV